MLRGLYTAASGMLAQQVHLDVLSNNLANVTTSGYRADQMITRAFPDILIHRIADGAGTGSGVTPTGPVPVGRLGTGVFVEGTTLSLEPGRLEPTGNPLDVAIIGDGFFLVETPAGVRLTRDGGFTISPDGWLVTSDGHLVLSAAEEPVRVVEPGTPARPVHIDGSATVWVDGQQVAALAVVSVDAPHLLSKEGGNRLVPNEASGPYFPLEDPRVEPGHREGSNVQAVTEMVRIISAFRAYEAAQRAVHAHDELLDRAVNEVGRL